MHIFVVPKRAVVLDPKTRKPLPKDGARVVRSSYWLRRLRDGDVEIRKEPAAKKAADKTTKAEG